MDVNACCRVVGDFTFTADSIKNGKHGTEGCFPCRKMNGMKTETHTTPKGRAPSPSVLRAVAARHAGEAIDALRQVANDPSADAAARVAAAQTIIKTASSTTGAPKC